MQRVGSRAQVMHGNAKMTGGGLRKKDLKYNKQGKIVSKKMSQRAKKEKRLQKAGYTTRKGQFGAVRIMRGGARYFVKYVSYRKKIQKEDGAKIFKIKFRNSGLEGVITYNYNTKHFTAEGSYTGGEKFFIKSKENAFWDYSGNEFSRSNTQVWPGGTQRNLRRFGREERREI